MAIATAQSIVIRVRSNIGALLNQIRTLLSYIAIAQSNIALLLNPIATLLERIAIAQRNITKLLNAIVTLLNAIIAFIIKLYATPSNALISLSVIAIASRNNVLLWSESAIVQKNITIHVDGFSDSLFC